MRLQFAVSLGPEPHRLKQTEHASGPSNRRFLCRQIKIAMREFCVDQTSSVLHSRAFPAMGVYPNRLTYIANLLDLPVSDSVSRGSNPRPPAKLNQRLAPLFARPTDFREGLLQGCCVGAPAEPQVVADHREIRSPAPPPRSDDRVRPRNSAW